MSPTVIIGLSLLAFSLLMLIPFVPGIIEFRRPKDNKPVVIDLEYSKDARYFGKSFRKMMLNDTKLNQPMGADTIRLSKKRDEDIRFTMDAEIASGETLTELLYVQDDLHAGNKSRFLKEVYVKGDCRMEENVYLRAMACDGKFESEGGLHVSRWLDVEKDIVLRGGADLGMSTTSGGRLQLYTGVLFNRLYGNPISVGEVSIGKLPILPEPLSYFPQQRIESISSIALHTKNLLVKPLQRVETDVVARGKITVSQGATIMGSIKAHGPIRIREGAVVAGNCFSNADIEIEKGARVGGNVFCQGKLILGPGVIIGKPDGVKSAVARVGMVMHEGAVIFGYVLAEGGGKTRV